MSDTKARTAPSPKAPPKLKVQARIIVVAPPPGVMFAVQRGARELTSPTISKGDDLRFDFTILADRDPAGQRRFSGEFVQGPRGGRFVYVNSGTLAGHFHSAWTRRAKIGLETITWAMLEKAAASGATLQVSFAGVGRDGGPACATVPLQGDGWTIEIPTSGTARRP